MKKFTRFTAQRLHQRRGPSCQVGATMVEFALVMPFALLLVFGIIQLGLMFSAKSIVNEGAFMAARAGAMDHAQLDPAQQDSMHQAMFRALIPLYQDTTNGDPYTRLAGAFFNAQHDTNCNGQSCLRLEILNPTQPAFDDFGVTAGGHTYIPNDNLEVRSHSDIGGNSGLSIQDANALKIKVTYGYEIKVPLMRSVLNSVICGVSSGIDAFGNGDPTVNAATDDCSNFYSQGRIPIVAYATVQMQTPAWQ